MKVFNQFLIPIFVGLITVVSVACESQVANTRSDDAPNDRIVDPDILDDEMREDVVLGVDLSSGDELPWFSFIFPKYNTSWQCAGVLIHENWVLTAAHCLNQTQGYIGFATSYEAMEEKKNQRRCNAWHVHPKYQEWGPDQDILVNDYALCYMRESIENTPIKIDPNFYPIDGDAVVAGFGATDTEGNEWPDAVKKATLPIVANEALSCQEQDRKQNICTFDPAGTDTCIGDSGGPLYISDEEEDILIGITSYGAVPYERTNLCGDPEFGGVYARVSSGYDWIVETLCKNATTDVPLPAECTYTLPKPKRDRCVDNPDFRKKGRDCVSQKNYCVVRKNIIIYLFRVDPINMVLLYSYN